MWNIMVDVSGMHPEDIYIGLILFNDQYKPLFLNEFYNKFPKLKRFNKKSSKVKPDILFEILKFFDEKRLRMVCYHFKEHQWKLHEKRINDLYNDINPNHKYRDCVKEFREKIMGILYYYAITRIGIKKDSYNVTVCNESCVNIWTVLDTVKKLARRDGWKIHPAANIRKIEHLLKMADYVAGANRKLEEFKINTVSRHTILKDPIRDFDLKKVFHMGKPIT